MADRHAAGRHDAGSRGTDAHPGAPLLPASTVGETGLGGDDEVPDMDYPETCTTCGPVPAPGVTVPLADVATDLDRLDTLEREIADLLAVLRATLPPAHFRLVWALRDAEERHGLAERALAVQQLVDGLARHLPEHAAAIRATAGHLLDDGDAGRKA